MELRLLQYYLAVVREGNISKAAEMLHMTQPTLSRQMTQLEKTLGTTLFVRGRHFELTDAGVMLKHRAEEVVGLMNKITDEFTQQREIGGVISIGGGGLYAMQLLTPIMVEFRKLHPHVTFNLYTNNADYIKERIEQGLLDFGLLLEPVDVAKFEYIRMPAREQWGLFMTKENPLASQDFITKDDILKEPLITSDRLFVQKEIEAWFGDSYSQLDIFATYNIITNAVNIVASGAASALTIEGAVSQFCSDKFVFRSLQPELSMTSVFAWKKLRTGFTAASAFLEYFKNNVARKEK